MVYVFFVLANLQRKNTRCIEKMARIRRVWGLICSLIIYYLVNINFVDAGGSTLVLLDNLTIRETHSIFFKSLQGKFYGLIPYHFHLSFRCLAFQISAKIVVPMMNYERIVLQGKF